MNFRTSFWLFARIVVGFIFAYAGFSKLLEPIQNFEAAILDYGIFPIATAKMLARIIPWIESIGGSFLVLGYLPRQSAGAIGALSLGFVILLGRTILMGHGAEKCGCFGESGIQLTTTQMFFLDSASFMTCVRLSLQKQFPFSLDSKLS